MKVMLIHFGQVALCALSTVALVLPGRAQLVSDVLAPYAERVDASIQRGLLFLASTQLEDGTFPGTYGRAPAVVSFVGMSFLAAGHQPGRGRYGQVINACIDYVLEQQREDTGFITAREGKDRGMYSHNSATLFLSEVSGMLDVARQAKVDAALPKALKVIVSAQNVRKQRDHDGGWRYGPTSIDSDLSCSGWALMALRSARLNGAHIPDENIERATQYVLGKQDPSDGGFGYQHPRSHLALSGVGALCLELSGYHGSKEMAMARSFLKNNYRAIARHRFAGYALYFYSQAAFQFGGDLWAEFAPWMYDTYLPLQRPDGSWPSATRDQDTPAYTVSMILSSFAVPYCQLPIFQRDETVDD